MQFCTRFETIDSGLLVLCKNKIYMLEFVFLSAFTWFLFVLVSGSLTTIFLLQVITAAIPDTVGGKLIGLVNTRDDIPDLLKVRTEI